ncbi:MAG TPA: hypothetical protein VLJ68_03770 [Chitinophagaceae bacterium]|nr:hypothetical protein [Chitinophagaceae bacterium]
MIHLISTVEAARISWLPQFIDHYKELGVDQFHITCQVPPDFAQEERERVYKEVKRLLAGEGIHECQLLVCQFDAMNLRNHHDKIQATIPADHWILLADIDEFHEYAGSLKAIIANCESNGINIIGGDFLDRVGPSGKLEVFDPGQPIWEQYPIGCNITQKVLKGHTNKVVCAKAYLKIKFANHDPLNGQRLYWYPERATVHHFKWDQSVAERLQFRLTAYWKKRCHWWVQTKRFFDHIAKYGKINLDTLQTSFPSYKIEYAKQYKTPA